MYFRYKSVTISYVKYLRSLNVDFVIDFIHIKHFDCHMMLLNTREVQCDVH